jgi:hypothetical protein
VEKAGDGVDEARSNRLSGPLPAASIAGVWASVELDR